MKRGSKRQSRGNNVVPSSQAPESEEKELPEDIKELLELIPEEKRSTALRKLSLTRVNTESYAGPLPHPQILAGYNQVIPGSADRIIQQAEDQAKHRQRVESMLAEQGVKQEKRETQAYRE